MFNIILNVLLMLRFFIVIPVTFPLSLYRSSRIHMTKAFYFTNHFP